MADTSDLSNFLTDVATAIRNKKGTTDEIPAADFDTEIEGIDTLKGQEINITPTTSEQVITPEENYNAITKATVSAVDNTIDENITANNIKKDITILGVTGTLEGSSEDLTTELTEQDTVVENLENSVQDKVLETYNFKAPDGLKFGITASTFTSIDFTGIDTSNVTDMSYMFNGCTGLTELNLSSFDTSNVTTMNQMFYNCTGLVSLDLTPLDTSSVTNMSYMFNNCTGLTSIDLSNFNTSSVTNMSGMFQRCFNLTELDLSNFNTSNVTSMTYMFYNCTGLTSIDLTSLDTSSVTNMSYMFSYCTGLTSIDLSNFDFTNVTSYLNMFSSVPTDCLIYVKDDTAKEWITSKFTTLTNVQIKS